jgi:hypothetical protein
MRHLCLRLRHLSTRGAAGYDCGRAQVRLVLLVYLDEMVPCEPGWRRSRANSLSQGVAIGLQEDCENLKVAAREATPRRLIGFAMNKNCVWHRYNFQDANNLCSTKFISIRHP